MAFDSEDFYNCQRMAEVLRSVALKLGQVAEAFEKGAGDPGRLDEAFNTFIKDVLPEGDVTVFPAAAAGDAIRRIVGDPLPSEEEVERVREGLNPFGPAPRSTLI